jgi:hypothetical protein
MRYTRAALVLVTAILATIFLILSWQNSLAVRSVSIRIREGHREHMDHSLPGIGREHRLPDYKVKLRVSRRLLAIDLGTRLDTSATNWLDFAVSDVVPARHVQEVIIIEDDKVENDPLDRIQGNALEQEGQAFHRRLTVERRFEVGMKWLFSTPVGEVLTVALALVILVLIAQAFRH